MAEEWVQTDYRSLLTMLAGDHGRVNTEGVEHVNRSSLQATPGEPGPDRTTPTGPQWPATRTGRACCPERSPVLVENKRATGLDSPPCRSTPSLHEDRCRAGLRVHTNTQRAVSLSCRIWSATSRSWSTTTPPRSPGTRKGRSPTTSGPRYVQHNPDAQDGPEAFIGFVDGYAASTRTCI